MGFLVRPFGGKIDLNFWGSLKMGEGLYGF